MAMQLLDYLARRITAVARALSSANCILNIDGVTAIPANLKNSIK
jgi:hypothetical protein